MTTKWQWSTQYRKKTDARRAGYGLDVAAGLFGIFFRRYCLLGKEDVPESSGNGFLQNINLKRNRKHE